MKNRKIHAALLLATTMMACRIMAQDKCTLEGVICGEDRRPLPGVAVLALDKTDASYHRGTVCNSNGRFELSLPRGVYSLECSLLGYEKRIFEYTVSGHVRTDSIFLHSKAIGIDEIVVRSPEIAYNPNGYSLQIGDNPAYKGLQLKDILSMAPGLWIERDKLEAFGKTVSKVYIDDREVKMSREALMQYLQTLSGENVRQIEVVLRSGVEDDAVAMGSRILRITTKRLPTRGALVTVSTGLSYTDTYLSVTPRLNVNLRRNRFSRYFTGASHYTPGEKFDSETEERFYESNTLNRGDSRDITRRPLSLGATWGLGYDITPNHLLSLEASWTEAKWNRSSRTVTRSESPEGAKEIADELSSDMRNRSTNLSFNYIWKLGERAKIVFKADWLHSESDREQHSCITGGDEEARTNNQDFSQDIYTAGADFTHAFRDGNDELSAGVKYAHTDNHSLSGYRKLAEGVWSEDLRFSDDYFYKERISAAYLRYAWKHDRFGAILGVRAEYVSIDPRSAVHPKNSVRSDYVDFFPQANVSYTFGAEKDHFLSLAYSRSLSRPPFSELNPYILPISSSSYMIGNPCLKPEYIDQLEFNATFRNKYVFTCSFQQQHDLINNRIFKEEDSDIIYQQNQNIGLQRYFSAYVQIPVWVSARWNLEASFSYRYTRLNYESGKRRLSSYIGSVKSTLRLPGDFVFLFTGRAFSRYLIANSKGYLGPMLTATVTKPILRNKFYVAFSANDILNSEGRFRLETYETDFSQIYRYKNRFRTFTLNLSYTFKSGKPTSVRRVEAGNEEERARE